MDTLIIGGLLVIGVGALIALFFVLRGGNTSQAKAPQAVPQTAREVLPTPAYAPPQQPQPSVSIPTQQHDATETEPEARMVPVAETTEQSAETHARPIQEQPLRVRLNGQFHELALGLRSLQQQATEMEQRLGSLNQMIESIERDEPEEK